MPSKLNQHFVPQYYFRVFNGGQKFIHLITKRKRKVIRQASVKGQCARHKYYGNTEVEDFLAHYDGRHSTAYRAVVREAWTPTVGGLSGDELYWLYEGLLLQRARVPRAASILASGSQEFAFYAFGNYLSAKHPELYEPFAEAVERGQARLLNIELSSLLHSIVIALRSCVGISDLVPVTLRNHSPFPFVFGDSPCVFYNRYLYDIQNRGVLGLTNPGLMILMPLDYRTQVMLYDPNVYRLVGHDHSPIDMIGSSDVSQLNALQILSALECVYFADHRSAEYVQDLVRAHESLFDSPRCQSMIYPAGSLLIDDKPSEGEAMLQFEEQLPLRLDLSFLAVRPIAPDEEIPRYRDRELRDELHRMLDQDEPAEPDG